MGMELQDAAALQELSHRNGERWGTNTALWVIAAVVVIAFVANIWSRKSRRPSGLRKTRNLLNSLAHIKILPKNKYNVGSKDNI